LEAEEREPWAKLGSPNLKKKMKRLLKGRVLYEFLGSIPNIAKRSERSGGVGKEERGREKKGQKENYEMKHKL
jgi:hypothetical protein